MKKILAIDDQQDNLTSIKALLKISMPEYTVLTAMSGQEGLEIAAKEQPDTILLDIIMPQMDGYEICKRLKEDETTKHIPVLMLTAIRTDSESRVKGLNMGADAFLSKPIDPVELSAQVNVMLRIKKAEDKLRADKKDMESIILERTSELEESEKQLQSLINAMPDFVCFKDRDGRWLKVNDACIRIFQLEGIEYQGKKDSELAELNSKLQSSFLTCKESNARAWKENNIIQGEETIPNSDGVVRIFDVTKVPVIHSNGERKGLVVFGHDITEHKQSEKELKKYRENLEELIKKRTKELEDKNKELERMNDLFVGREFRIKELRDKVKELEKRTK